MSFKKNLKAFVTSQRVLVLGASVFSATVGAGFSYALTKQRMTLEFEKLLDKELESAREYYQDLYSKVEESIEEEVVEEEDEAEVSEKEIFERERKYHGVAIDRPVEVSYTEAVEEVREVKNVFDESEAVEEFDYEKELAKRDPDRPYIITQEEFFENEPGYHQTNLSYFQGDGVLSDDTDDEAFKDASVIGGEENLRFGFGSRDRNLVYIRNDEIETDFEVSHSYGSYADEVLGLEHVYDDSHRVVRKFRGDRE